MAELRLSTAAAWQVRAAVDDAEASIAAIRGLSDARSAGMIPAADGDRSQVAASPAWCRRRAEKVNGQRLWVSKGRARHPSATRRRQAARRPCGGREFVSSAISAFAN
jgi:hypothetical protein